TAKVEPAPIHFQMACQCVVQAQHTVVAFHTGDPRVPPHDAWRGPGYGPGLEVAKADRALERYVSAAQVQMHLTRREAVGANGYLQPSLCGGEGVDRVAPVHRFARDALQY